MTWIKNVLDSSAYSTRKLLREQYTPRMGGEFSFSEYITDFKDLIGVIKQSKDQLKKDVVTLYLYFLSNQG